MNPGDELRDTAADFFEIIYGTTKKEIRANGKKVDIYCETQDFGRTRRLYIEAKDYTKPLQRKQLATIHSDYSGIIRTNGPADLVIITRNGITTDANAFIEEHPDVRHLTIDELENFAIGLDPYIKYLAQKYQHDTKSGYYIQPHFLPEKDRTSVLEFNDQVRLQGLDEIWQWVGNNEDSEPIAILGGYGAGKTSLADYIAISQAQAHIRDNKQRIPILIKLGQFVYASKLSGVLAELFQSDHNIESYSYHRFREFHDRGRFLVILDGFDEMKHAMSWTDFSYIVSELAKMNNSQSKIMLLGRPSAFTSDNEAKYVLRGLRKTQQTYIRMPNWPHFRTYEIAPFDREQREKFILNYLNAQKDTEDDEISDLHANRVTVVTKIVERNTALFSRPVHLKMLVDLASGTSISEADLEKIDSHWTLYEFFIDELLTRERMKDARRSIPDEARREFLMRLALWLWRDNDAQTHFSIEKIPESLIPNEFDSIDDVDAQKRELITIPLIDRNAGNFCYFVHRSFAEFLIALSFISETDYRRACHIYPALLTDGIISFIEEVLCSERSRNFINELVDFRGFLSPAFLELIYNSFDDGEPGEIICDSPWASAFNLISYSYERSKVDDFLCDLLSKGDPRSIALTGDAIFQGQFNTEIGNSMNAYQRIALTILERFFASVAWNVGGRGSIGTVEGEDACWVKQLVTASFLNPTADGAVEPTTRFYPARLERFLRREASKFGYYTSTHESDGVRADGFVSISYEQYVKFTRDERTAIAEFFKRERSFKTIAEVGAKVGRKR